MARPLPATFIFAVVALGAGMAAVGGWRFARASAPVNGPIVLVSVDSLRADRLSPYRYTAGRTPSLSMLAADGITFERAYSHIPQSLPSHVSMLTGRLPFETGVRDAASALPPSTRTVAQMLRDRGYETGAVVSSWLLRRDTGISRGFDFFDDELPPPSDVDARVSLVRDGDAAEEVAEHWLDTIGTSRAFLFLHIAEPHAPHTPPDRFADLSAYDGEVAHADEVIGRLIRYLKAHQMYDRTTIVVVSDHGESLGDHGEQTHGLLPSESTLRVPLIVKLPGSEEAGRRVGAVVRLIDLVPTILDLAKAPGSSSLSGRSLAPLFSGGRQSEVLAYAESGFGKYRFGWVDLVSVVEGRYRLVTAGDQDELFDLEADPAGTVNVAADHPDIAAALRARLRELVREPVELSAARVTPADRERYEALGQVGTLRPPGLEVRTIEDGTSPVPVDDVGARVAFIEAYRQAVDLKATRQWNAAADAFAAMVREDKSDPDLWIQLGLAAARGERHETAVDAYRRALALTPDSVAARLGAAASLVRMRRFVDAAEYARAVIEAGTAERVQAAEAHELLARVALGRRDPDAARTEAAQAEEADALRPVAAFVEGRIALDAGQLEQAAAAFSTALDAAATSGRPPLADLRVYAAQTLVRLNRPDEAEALFDAELKAFPANQRARTGLQALQRAARRTAAPATRTQH